MVGYSHSHLSLVTFDEEGNILWDGTFPIGDVRTTQLKKVVDVSIIDDKIHCVYNYAGLLKSTTFDLEGNTSGEKDVAKLYTGSSSSQKSVFYDSKIQSWYDDFYLASGKEQNRKNAKKHLFYLTRIQYK